MFRKIKILSIISFFTYCFSQQPSPVSTLISISGLADITEGAVKLLWTYPGPDVLPENSVYYIQYSTFTEGISWSTSSAQVRISTGPVNVYEEQVYILTGLDEFVKSNSLDKNTTFYFVLWISSGTVGYLSGISNVATGWFTIWLPYAEFISGAETQGVHEGEISLQFQGCDDYVNENLYNALTGYWYIQYSTDEYFLSWSTAFAQVKISTHTYPSYQWYAGFTVTGLTGGVTYYFRLWAEDDLGNLSEISNGATTWAQLDISGPKQVTTLFVVSCGFRHVQLSWIFPYEDSYSDGFIYNSSTYTGSYKIRYRNNQGIYDDSLWSSATEVFYLSNVEIIPLTSSSVVISNLVNNTSYYFSIKVADERNNWSLVSSSSPFVKPYNSPPQAIYPQNHFSYDPIRNTTSTIISTTTVVLYWSNASWHSGYSGTSFDSQYGDYISSYTIKIATYLVSGTLGIPVISSYSIVLTSITVYDLSEDTTYYWNLTVYDSESLSSTTAVFKFIINSQNSNPLFPTNPLISPTTVWHTNTHTITFDWKDAYDFDAGDFIVGYQLIISTDVNFSVILTTIPTTGLLTNSYFQMTDQTTPSSDILLPYENRRLYWYVIAYDSGAPFGYERVSTQTPVGSFWINQVDEPPKNFEIYFPSGTPTIISGTTYYKVIIGGTTFYPLMEKIIDGTTYYIAKSTPIILSWYPTFDPDPEDGIYEYAVFISSWREPYAQGEVGWRYVENKDEEGREWYPPYPQYTWFQPSTIFLSTSIVNFVEPGTGSQPPVELVENATYFWRVRARDGWNPNPSSGWIWLDDETFSPPLDTPPASFIIDFTSDAPTGYDIVSPTGVINPNSLQGPIEFKWTRPFDPDPFDTIKFYFLSIATVTPSNQDGWYTLPAPLWKINTWVQDVDVTTTSVMFTKPTLQPAVTYYWQVHCWGKNEWDNAVDPSTSTPFYVKPYGFAYSTGSFVVSNQKPYKFYLLSPGVTTYSQTIAPGIKTYRPTFYWEQVYDPDNYDPVVSSYVVVISSYQDFIYRYEIYSSTTYLELLFDLQPRTTYFWYVKAYDNFGNFQTPYATFYFRTENFAPSEFELYFPTNNEVVSNSQPIFKWYNEGDPDNDDLYYTIYCSSYSDFTFYLSSGEFRYTPSKGVIVEILSPWIFEDNKQYFWYVVAEDKFGGVTTSTIHSFWINSIEEKPVSFDINITSGVITQQNILLNWQSTSDPDPKDYVSYYKICFSSTPNYVVGVSTYIIVYTSYTTSYNLDLSILSENARYLWWVEAYDTKSNFTKSNSSYTFIVDIKTEPPDEIYLVTPGSTYSFVRISQPIKLEWTPANKTEWWKGVSYKLHLAAVDTLIYPIITLSSGPFKNYTEVVNFSYSTSTLKENTTYFWYVQAENLTGTKTSPIYYFFVDSQNDPPQFSIISPTGTVNTRRPVFVWEQAKDVDDEIDKYELKFSYDKNFDISKTTTIVLSDNETSFQPNYKLLMNTTYYFKIRAYDKRGLWAEKSQQFYIPYFKLSPVEVITPKNTVFTRKPLLQWSSSIHTEPNSFVSSYSVTLYSIDNKIVEQILTQTTFYQIKTNLVQNITYYFTVIPIDDEGIYGEATTGYFFVAPINIPAPVEKISYSFDKTQPWLFNIYWEKVNYYTDGTIADDIAGYNIYRAETYELLLSSVNNKQVYMFIPSTITFLSDPVYYTTYYYLIKVVTIGGVESEPSDVVTSYNAGSKIISTPFAKIYVSKNVDEEISKLEYKIILSSQQVSQTEQERLNIISKYSIIAVSKDNKTINYKFGQPIIVELPIGKISSSPKLTQTGEGQSLNLVVFYNNGIELVYLPSQYDIQNGLLSFKATITGEYVLRTVYFATEAKIIQIYPKKIFTPTAPKDNKIHFVISNPYPEPPEGEIYDINLRYVAKMKYENYELIWDGRYENNEVVPKGIYIYKIKIGEKTFSGTIIVAK